VIDKHEFALLDDVDAGIGSIGYRLVEVFRLFVAGYIGDHDDDADASAFLPKRGCGDADIDGRSVFSLEAGLSGRARFVLLKGSQKSLEFFRFTLVGKNGGKRTSQDFLCFPAEEGFGCRIPQEYVPIPIQGDDRQWRIADDCLV